MSAERTMYGSDLYDQAARADFERSRAEFLEELESDLIEVEEPRSERVLIVVCLVVGLMIGLLLPFGLPGW